MANFYKDNPDLQFYLEKGLDWNPLLQLVEKKFGKDQEFKDEAEALGIYKDMLEMVGEFVAEEVDPKAASIDQSGIELVDGEIVFPQPFQDIFDQIKELELHGMGVPRELGGMNCPLTLYFISMELFARADISVAMHHGFHGGMANAMLSFSIDEGTTEFDKETQQIKSTRFAKEIQEIVSGETCSCMDITEPDAGSDMAALRTTATQDKDGNWVLNGQKIFITSGNGKHHFVIARTETAKDNDDAFAGLKGLSFFLCPTYEIDKDGNKIWHATIDRIEEKMGIHGSPTCAITFENSPAELIGERGDGFKHMLLLMNGARLGVGFMSLGLCESAYRLAKEYAGQRHSMGKPIERHEMIADYLDEMETDIRAIRALAMHGSYHEEMSKRLEQKIEQFTEPDSLEARRLKQQMKDHTKAARRITPLVKYFGSEKSVEMARRCIQIHGGAGYTQEYRAEQLLRDAIILPIYEGTSQIQALMAMKDTLGEIVKNPQQFVKKLAQTRWRSLSVRDPLEKRVAKLQLQSLNTQQHLMQKIAVHKFKTISQQPISTWPNKFFQNWNPKTDFSYGLLHAERLIRILSDVAICELLFEQAQQHPERREILERFLERAEPRGRFLHDEITSTGDRLLGTLHPDSSSAELSEASSAS